MGLATGITRMLPSPRERLLVQIKKSQYVVLVYCCWERGHNQKNIPTHSFGNRLRVAILYFAESGSSRTFLGIFPAVKIQRDSTGYGIIL